VLIRNAVGFIVFSRSALTIWRVSDVEGQWSVRTSLFWKSVGRSTTVKSNYTTGLREWTMISMPNARPTAATARPIAP